MPEFLDTPDFKSEKEEAEWWNSPEGRAAIQQGFKQAERDGTLRRGTSWAKLRAAMPPESQERMNERLQTTLAKAK